MIALFLAAAALVSWTREGNRVTLRLAEGSAELEWISDSSFRFRRPAAGGAPKTGVGFQPAETLDALTLTNRYLAVHLAKADLRLRVGKRDGTPLFDAPGDRERLATGRLYGAAPLLFSSAGYGEYWPGAAAFDFTTAGRYRVQSPATDFYFYYGPTPKEIYEEHLAVAPIEERWSKPVNSLAELLHATLAGVLVPMLNGTGRLPALVNGGDPRLAAFFTVYRQEARDRGYPIARHLSFQFPFDPEAGRQAGTFALGDELVVGDYLPPGIWTHLESNRVFKGRQMVALEEEAPLFVRNGTILPLNATPMELHYFPRLAAEFFLLEEDIGEWTQFHAAPAADILRLEVEAKKAREYEWVVHHVDKPARVGFGELVYEEAGARRLLRPRSWFYDAGRRNLHVRLRVAAGEDVIVNLY